MKLRVRSHYKIFPSTTIMRSFEYHKNFLNNFRCQELKTKDISVIYAIKYKDVIRQHSSKNRFYSMNIYIFKQTYIHTCAYFYTYTTLYTPTRLNIHTHKCIQQHGQQSVCLYDCAHVCLCMIYPRRTCVSV